MTTTMINRVGSGDKGSAERIQDDFALFGIRKEDVPSYTNAREFARRFRRCSILEMDEVKYAAATGADGVER